LHRALRSLLPWPPTETITCDCQVNDARYAQALSRR